MPNEPTPQDQGVLGLAKANINCECTCCCRQDCDTCLFYKYHGQDIAKAFISQEAELTRLREECRKRTEDAERMAKALTDIAGFHGNLNCCRECHADHADGLAEDVRKALSSLHYPYTPKP